MMGNIFRSLLSFGQPRNRIPPDWEDIAQARERVRELERRLILTAERRVLVRSSSEESVSLNGKDHPCES